MRTAGRKGVVPGLVRYPEILRSDVNHRVANRDRVPACAVWALWSS